MTATPPNPPDPALGAWVLGLLFGICGAAILAGIGGSLILLGGSFMVLAAIHPRDR